MTNVVAIRTEDLDASKLILMDPPNGSFHMIIRVFWDGDEYGGKEWVEKMKESKGEKFAICICSIMSCT